MSMLHVTAGRGGQIAIILTFCWLQGQLCHIQWHFGPLRRHLCQLQTTGRLNKPQGQLSHKQEQFCKLQGQLYKLSSAMQKDGSGNHQASEMALECSGMINI